MEILKGGCYCGAIRYEITGPPRWSGHCHCRSCQLALGGAFVTWSKVAAADFTITSGSLKQIEKTLGIRRGFCGDCGTTLTYAADSEMAGQDWSADAWFAATTLDDPSVVEPKAHVFVSHQQPWIKLADQLPRFEEF
ncbi:GFA family protein [Boseongicola aestuarii]|uniref:Glutathione-dependent formaldehyde-activating enzyme n=1 Tax=Boseongicola aestuarii TaxID=1470561 RepID=A0A238J5Z5_9RHOB|nr:GFA family protein [Boseongicola aestuarii]SMX25652.1 Glutathione-dependent formaldehyde-activating enzyme [Boseongicola aestuarii]